MNRKISKKEGIIIAILIILSIFSFNYFYQASETGQKNLSEIFKNYNNTYNEESCEEEAIGAIIDFVRTNKGYVDVPENVILVKDELIPTLYDKEYPYIMGYESEATYTSIIESKIIDYCNKEEKALIEGNKIMAGNAVVKDNIFMIMKEINEKIEKYANSSVSPDIEFNENYCRKIINEKKIIPEYALDFLKEFDYDQTDIEKEYAVITFKNFTFAIRPYPDNLC